MKRPILRAALLLAVAGSAVAQPVDGEVLKIDKAQARITLKHGPIKNLAMPAMSMTYRLADPKWVERYKVGDKVRFEADRVDGYYLLTKLDHLP